METKQNKPFFITIEQIKNGFVLITSDGAKTYKSTFNGVVDFLGKSFGTFIIKDDNRVILKSSKEPVEIIKDDDTDY
jgi:hypothetical protein